MSNVGDVQAVLMYGRKYKDVVKNLTSIEIEKLNEDINTGDIYYAMPHENADKREWFIGYELPTLFDSSNLCGFKDMVLSHEEKFTGRFGILGKIQALSDFY